MAEAPTGRSFTEGEAYALVDQAVKNETAALTTQVETLTSEKASLQGSIDVLETEKAALTTRAEKAEQDLADYQAKVENEKAAEAKRGERTAKVSEINPKLLEGEGADERITRIVAMDETAFEGYLGDIRQAASLAAPAGGGKQEPPAPAPIPAQTAAFGGSGATTDDAPKGAGVLELFGAARGVTPAE